MMRAGKEETERRRPAATPEEPVRPAPVPAPGAELVLTLQRGAGNAAVARLLARAPAASVETAGHEEASWARPSTKMATDPVHVATIHFRTKEWTIDAKDEEVLKALAEAYGPYASRNIHKPKEPQGLRGRIVGYTDPRRSAGPDNQALSENRANWTWRHLLRHLVRASGVIEGHFDLERIGAGVAPEAHGVKDDAPAAEGNLLAPFRKVEIFLSGQGVAPAAEPPKPADRDDKRVTPPNLDNWNKKEWEHSDWDMFDAYIDGGHKREIQGYALRIEGWTQSEGDYIDEILEWAPTTFGVASVGAYDLPKIGFKKPPWWDNRGADLQPTLGRGGWTESQKLKYKAKLLRRDMIETAKWSEIHVSSKRSTLNLLVDEVRKDNPDRAKIDKWVQDLEYLRYMIDDVQNSAGVVSKLAD